MASRKKGTAPHKPKKVYESVKLMNCARCGRDTTHTLFDYDNSFTNVISVGQFIPNVVNN